jgi:hypothetical protein
VLNTSLDFITREFHFEDFIIANTSDFSAIIFVKDKRENGFGCAYVKR